ncbi:MAG TPA: Ig-like domain-containing protein [Patescibacteria group bacterium]|nr:Ig-like domain-containing protein [Patescibacteria group bacterium]
MSEFRLWLHHQIARLDGTRERRFVALAASLIFATLALGPQALHVVDAAVNQPDIRIDDVASPAPNPVRFTATVLNALVGQMQFLVTGSDGATQTIPGQMISSADPSRWISTDFLGIPGVTYSVKARGLSTTATGTVVESLQAITFSIFDPNAQQGSGGSTPPPSGSNSTLTAELLQLIAWPGTEPKIEARGQATGFVADSGYFRAQSVTGLAFLGTYEAERAADGTWHGLFAVPGGELYRVTFVAREPGGEHASQPLEVAVPVAEATSSGTTDTTTNTDTSSSTSNATPPPAPVVAMLLPSDGAELTSPVPLAARVANATATNLVFEILDPAGVTRTLPAGAGGGDWTAMFTGGAGQYRVGARAFLPDNVVIAPNDFRSFRILADATSTTTAQTTTDATAETAPAPVVELFSPVDGAEPFPAAVPISARVRDGVPDKVVAIVIGPDGRETIVIASKSASGDYWTSLFEGPDGIYRFRVRALVAGKDVFSDERRFAIKHPLTATAPPPATSTAALPPPPPPPTGATTPLPPPPPPPTSTTATGELPPTTASGTSTLRSGAPAFDVSIPEALAEECRAAGILPARCAEWLKVRHQSRECLDAGAVTREACVEILGRLNIPVDEAKTFGMARASDIQDAADAARGVAGQALKPADMPPAIGRLLAFQPRPEERWRVLASRDDAAAVLVLDTDGDGLPDDAERRFGTDPDAADTDGDGFSDGQEVKNGYNPLGGGTLERPLRGVEKALLEGLPIEDPRGGETPADPAFTIAAGAGAATSTGEVIRLAGTAAPNTVVTIFVYSYLPIVVTTTTDANGAWTYDFGSKLADGRHEAYVSVNDDTGKLVAASSPLAFFVKEAQAVSESDFLRPDVNVEEAPATFSRWFIIGGAALVLLALALVFAIIRQARKEPDIGPGPSV